MSFEEKEGSEKKIVGLPWVSLMVCALSTLASGIIPAESGAQEASPPVITGARGSPEQNLLKQKIRLLERLLEKLERNTANQRSKAQSDLQKAKHYLERALEAVKRGTTDLAEALIDKAFADVTRLMRRQGPVKPSKADLRSRYDKLREVVNKFREALLEVAREKNQEPSALKIDEVDALLREARNWAVKGNFKRANAGLDSAYGIVVAKLAEVRANDTVIHSLEFDSPAEEFRYEKKRYLTHELLVKLLLSKRELDDATLRLVKSEVDQAAALDRKAREHERRGDYQKAVKTEEAAIDLLINALRKGGLYLPK